MSSSLLHFKGTHHQCNLSLCMLNWSLTLLEFVRFLHSKVTIPPPTFFSMLLSLKSSHYVQPNLREQRVIYFPSMRVNLLHKLFGIFLPRAPVFSSPFDHLIICSCQYELRWIFISYFRWWSNTPFVLMLKLFCIWQLKALSFGAFVLTYIHHHLCFY